jgi:hypothetical protein
MEKMPSLKTVPAGACPEDRAYCSDFKLGSNGKCKFSKYAVTVSPKVAQEKTT